MSTFGLVLHRGRAGELARSTVAWLRERGHEVRVADDDSDILGDSDLVVPTAELANGADLVISLGGDGTMLRAVALAAPDDVPVLGVNLGQLGYLTQVEPSGVRMALKRFLAGSYSIEERMRLDARVEGPDGELTIGALNEVVIEKSEMGHTVRLEVLLDGRPFTSYVADGLVLSTPTGSTAYAFSVRGPIIDPRHSAVLMVPVAPHMLFDRTLVLDAETTVDLEVRGEAPARVSVDGRPGALLAEGDVVRCRAAKQPARLVGFGSYDFHRTLREKFGLSDR